MKTMVKAEAKRAREKITAIEQSIEIMLNLPKMDGIVNLYASPNTLFVTSVYDMPIYRKNRQALAEAGWIPHYAFTVSSEGSRYTELKRGNERLTYIMKVTAPGSTCVREQVDEVTQPVYRVTCK